MKKLFLSCIMLLLLSGVCAAVPAFVEQDIDLSDEAISEQSSLLWESDGFYTPEEKVTCDSLIKLCVRMHLLYYNRPMTFDENDGYDVYLSYCKSNGIINDDDTSFDVKERPVLRHELATLITSVFPKEFFEVKNDITFVPDVKDSEKYHDAVLLLYKSGVVFGTDDRGYFCPTSELKKTELDVVFERLVIMDSRLDDSIITLPKLNEAYYLIHNTGMVRSTRGIAQVSSSWNYDNRHNSAIVDSAQTSNILEDSYTDGYVAINRAVEKQTSGEITFYSETAITSGKNGARIYFENSRGEVVFEIFTANGVYKAKGKSTVSTRVAVTDKNTVIKVVLNLDKKTASVAIDGVYKTQVSLGDFGDIYKVYFSTTESNKLTFAVNRCYMYCNYPVNESFYAPKVPYDWSVGNGEVVDSSADPAGDHVLSLSKSTTAKKTFDAISGKVVFESYFYIPETEDMLTISMGDILVGTTGGYINTGSCVHSFKNHIWQSVRIEADTETKKASWYVNGKHKSDFDITDTSFSQISFDYVKNNTAGYLLLDDVKVYNVYDYPDYCPKPVKAESEGYEVIMSVCSLWREGTHYGWDFVSPYDECSPLMGYYDEGLPETADWETKFMVEHGVDAIEYCWYATNKLETIKAPRLNWACHDGYFYGKYSDMVDFFIMWENQEFKSLSSMSLDEFRTQIWDYWVEWYFRDDRYYRIDNKAVIHMYRTDYLLNNMGSVEKVREMFDFMREDIKNYGYDGLIILAQDKPTTAERVKELHNMGYDGLCVYSWDSSSYDPKYLKSVNDNLLKLIEESGTGMFLVPTVATGRNILGWENARTPLADKDAHKEVLGNYKDILHKQDSGYNMIYLSTWNEYGEGHWLAPSGFNAFDYLEAWREELCTNQSVHNDIIPTENQKDRICKLYNDTRTPIRSLLFETPDNTDIPQSTVFSFEFNDSSELADWSIYSGHVKSYDISDGCINLVAADRDPMMSYKHDINLNASDVDAIHIRMRCNAASTFTVFFNYENNGVFSEERRLEEKFNGIDKDFVDIYLLTNQTDAWKNTIRRVRFDYASLEIPASIDFIRFVKFQPRTDDFAILADGKELDISYHCKWKRNDEYYVAPEAYTGFYNACNIYSEWSRFTEKLYLNTSTDTEFEFSNGSDIVYVNGTPKKLAEPFSLFDGVPVLPLKFILDNAGIRYEISDGEFNIIQRDYDYRDIISARLNHKYNFEITGDREGWTAGGATSSISDGHYILISNPSSSASTGYDPSMSIEYTMIDASEYNTVTVRLKYEFYTNTSKPVAGKCPASVYFSTTDDATLNEEKSVKLDLMNASVDSQGYTVLTFNMSSNSKWKGTISTIRFDPSNYNGKYSIDYIHFL